jgi:hypothetical protein
MVIVLLVMSLFLTISLCILLDLLQQVLVCWQVGITEVELDLRMYRESRRGKGSVYSTALC